MRNERTAGCVKELGPLASVIGSLNLPTAIETIPDFREKLAAGSGVSFSCVSGKLSRRFHVSCL